MKKIIFTSLAVLTISTAQAGFIINIALEQVQGGAVANGSINITPRTPGLPVENWQPTEPLYGEWIIVGEPLNCTNWSPEPSTVALGETFTQTATDCEQQQTRTRQDREQEMTTLAARSVGDPSTENQTIVRSSTRAAEGTIDTWEAFADAKNFSKNWDDLSWSFRNLKQHTKQPISINYC